MKAYVRSCATRESGERDSFWCVECEVREQLLAWQKRGLQYTASGYGKRIPTPYMIRFNGKWRRVYCCIFSNSGTYYIGNGDMVVVFIGGDV